MKQMIAPNGRKIVGTFDKIPGVAGVQGWTVDANGKLEPEYDGTGTEVWWDDQYTETNEAGVLWVVDENNEQHLVTDCKLVDE
jgi:hypothetical protein